MENNLTGQRFVEKASYELIKAGIKTFNYEKEDCDFTVGYYVDIKDDSGSMHQIIVNIECSDDFDTIIIGMPTIKLDQDDLNNVFFSGGDTDFSKYFGMFSEYFETREHFLRCTMVQSDPTDAYSKIVGARFTLILSREMGLQIFYDEDSITVMDYLNRLAYMCNDFMSLAVATIVGYGNFEKMADDIFEKYHLER